METGTHHSVNTYYVQLEERTGVEGPAALAESMGVRQFAERHAVGAAQPRRRVRARRQRGQPAGDGRRLRHLRRPRPVLPAARGHVDHRRRRRRAAAARAGVQAGPRAADRRHGQQRAARCRRPAARPAAPAAAPRSAARPPARPARRTSPRPPGSSATPRSWPPPCGSATPAPPAARSRACRTSGSTGSYYPQVYGGGVPAAIFRGTMRPALRGRRGARLRAPGAARRSREDVAGAGRRRAVARRRPSGCSSEAGLSVRDGGRVSGTRYRRGTAAYTVPARRPPGRLRRHGHAVRGLAPLGRRRAVSR